MVLRKREWGRWTGKQVGQRMEEEENEGMVEKKSREKKREIHKKNDVKI